MLQSQISSRTSLAVVSMCAEGSMLLRKREGTHVIYKVPELRPTVVRTESLYEQIVAPTDESVSEPRVERSLTILSRGTGCALHGSRMVHGFGRAVQIRHGYFTRRDIKARAKYVSDFRRGRREGLDEPLDKPTSWKERRRHKQWE